MTVDQTDHIIKMTTAHFLKTPFKKTNIPFRTDRTVEDEIANVQPYTPTTMNSLNNKFGEYSSIHSSINHVSMCSRPDVSCSTTRLGYFLTAPCALGYTLLHKAMCYLQSYPNKPLIFPKYPKTSERVLRMCWSSNKSEDFTFENSLEAFQDAGHVSEKTLRSSYGMGMHIFMGTVCAWNIYRFFIPINSSDTEMKTLFK